METEGAKRRGLPTSALVAIFVVLAAALVLSVWIAAGSPMAGGPMGGHMGGHMGGESTGPQDGPGAPARELTETPASGAALTVTAFDYGFRPSSLETAAGPTRIVLVNEGGMLHDLTIDGINVHIVATGGAAAERTYDLPPGTYTYYCSVPGHRSAGMEGRLTVA